MSDAPISVNVLKNDWCVYTHHTPSGELLYVGFDKISNALQTHHLVQNETWKRTVVEYGGWINITIVERFPDKGPAMIAANTMRTVHKPLSQQGGRRSAGFVRSIDTDVYYFSGAIAAKHHQISASAMANHLNRRKGYDKVHGMVFERVLTEPPEGAKIVNKVGVISIHTKTPNVAIDVTTPVQSPGVASLELIWSMYNKDLQTPDNVWPAGVTDWQSYYEYTVNKLVTEFGWTYKAPEPHQIAQQQQVPPVEEDKHPPLPWFTGED